MTYSVINDRLQQDGVPVPFVPTPNQGGRMTPTGIVYHDTAGRLNKGSSVTWLINPKAKASAHLVIERDGSVTQLADFDRQTWHAGRSSHKGRSGCNGWMIGIEIVNPGKLDSQGYSWFGGQFRPAVEMKTPEHGTGYWYGYTDAQIETIVGITEALVRAYPIKDASDLTRHCDISPGRKVDVNPLFPLDRIRLAAFRMPPSALDAGGVAGVWPLEMGSRGEEVKSAQAALKSLGYAPGPVDGIFGAQTRRAVRAWEDENGGINDGKIDSAEHAELTAKPSKEMPIGPATAAAKSEAVAAAEKVKTTSAGVAGAATVSLMATDGLWESAMSGLGGLVDVHGKFNALGIPISPRLVVTLVIISIALAVISWANTAKKQVEQ